MRKYPQIHTELTLKAVKKTGIARLGRAGVYSPEGDMAKIIEAVLGERSPKLARVLSKTEVNVIEKFVREREARKPLPRILGRASFYGLELKTHSSVFQPYPETEILVDIAAGYCQHEGARLRILDVGTGSGCLLLALLSVYPDATGLGVDRDQSALDAAAENAGLLGLADRAAFRISDWTSGIGEQFDLVISNPPRVPSPMIPALLPEMRDFDPRTAYDGGSDGLTYFRRFAQDFATITRTGGIGVLQVSDPEAVIHVLRRYGYSQVRIHNNYIGIPAAVSVIHS